MAAQRTTRLPALTSLRFFAAAFIVLCHWRNFTNTHGYAWIDALGYQIVSFFFLLSGFILCHVYARMGGWDQTRRFFVTRGIRVFPVHLACLGLTLALLPATRRLMMDRPAAFVANLTLMQTWIPSMSYQFGWNTPSWSISADLFCYLCFPLLILNLRKTWIAKMALVTVGLAAVLLFASRIEQWSGQSGSNLELCWLIRTNPLTRLFEFVAGMVLRYGWGVWASHVPSGRRLATSLEVTALAAPLAVLALMKPVDHVLDRHLHVAHEIRIWLWQGGYSLPTSAFMIATMALGRGQVTEWLSRPVPMMLGEMSYSLYMTHWPLVCWWFLRPSTGSLWLSAAGFFSTTLAVSFLVWLLVERPSRDLASRFHRKAAAAVVVSPPARLAA